MKRIRVAFTAFLTFLGYCTFVAMIGGGIFWYIGHKKAMQTVESTVTLQEVSMTPAKEEAIPATDPLPEPPQVSKRPRKSAKPAPVSVRKAPTAPAKKPAPVTYAAPKETRTVQAEKAKPVKAAKPKAQKPRPAATTHADLGLPEEPLRVTYRVTDRTNPRTGAGPYIGFGPNVHETTELQREAKRRADLEQLKATVEQLKNPPVEQTALMELFFGGEK